MQILQRYRFFPRSGPRQGGAYSLQLTITPVVAGLMMLCASVLPWLIDPIGKSYSAWKLPIDIGWQFHLAILNYGLLCLCCAIYAFVIAYAHWQPFRGSRYVVQQHTFAGLVCLLPVMMFLWQYLFSDVQGIAQLAQHETQMLLIQSHFGYSVAQQRLQIRPFTLNIATFWDRLKLLVDQGSIGVLLPCVSAWLLLECRRFFTASPFPPTKQRRKVVWLVCILAFVLLLVVFGRAPAAMLCEYQAKTLLGAGNYTSALKWLDTAAFLNPELNEVAYYHIERGQALYFLYPDEQSDDSRVYLAAVYRNQRGLVDAYQQLLTVKQAGDMAPWVVDEMSTTLEELAEGTVSQDMNSTSQEMLDDAAALTWLDSLTQIDHSTVYGHYVIGRIAYELHDYSGCITQMNAVLQLGSNSDLQSSAYTYMALSEAGQGNYVSERELLFKAVQLDPNYHNNTAREELSGLH